MRAGGGKRKGGSFERLVCEKLSRWIDPAGSDAHFWRSAMSGGRATVRAGKGKLTKSQAGDISALTAMGLPFCDRFMIECKHIKKLKIAQALVSGTGLLAEFWRKLADDADHHGKKPLLIARQNAMPILAMMRADEAFNYFRLREEVVGTFHCLDTRDVLVFRFEDIMARKYRPTLFGGDK